MASFLSAQHHCCWLFATASLDHLLSRQLLTDLTPSEACSGVCGFASHCYSDSMHHAEPRLARLRLNEERQAATPSLQTRSLATDPWRGRRSKFASSHQSSSHSWRQKACGKISDNHDVLNMLSVLLLLVSLCRGRRWIAVAMTRGASYLLIALAIVSRESKKGVARVVGTAT